VVGQTDTASGNWAIYGYGNIGASGTKSAIVPAENGAHRTLYCMESPECWFEDFGSATLAKGSATVTIDPLFAATVDTSQYHIFLTPKGDSKGLYVNTVSAQGFTVAEQQGGTSSLSFSYRIVAKRKDVSAPRLALAAMPVKPAGGPAAPNVAKPTLAAMPARPATTVAPSIARRSTPSQGQPWPTAVTTPPSPAVPPVVSVPPTPPMPNG